MPGTAEVLVFVGNNEFVLWLAILLVLRTVMNETMDEAYQRKGDNNDSEDGRQNVLYTARSFWCVFLVIYS